MTTPTTSMWLCPIVITGSSDNGIAVNDGAAVTATVTAGTYYISNDGSATDFLQAVETALDAVGTGVWTVTLSSNKISFTCNTSGSAWSMDWDNAATTIDTTIFGIADTSAAFGAADNVAKVCDYVPTRRWISDNPATEWSQEPKRADIKQSRSADGNMWTRLSGSAITYKPISYNYETEANSVTPESGSINSDWASAIFPYLDDGAVRFYPDSSDTDTYTTGTIDIASVRDFEPRKMAAGIDLWSWGGTLVTITNTGGTTTEDAPDGDTAWFFKLNETEPATAHADSSANGLDMPNPLGSQASPLLGFGPYSSVLQLDNGSPTSTYTAQYDPADIYTGTDWTIYFWIITTNGVWNAGGALKIIAFGSDTRVEINNKQFSVYHNVTGSGAKTTLYDLDAGGYSPNTWHLLAATFTTDDLYVRLYVDGVLKATSLQYTGGTTSAFMGTNPGRLYFYDYMNLQLFGLKMQNVCMTAAQILAKYQAY